MKKTICRLTVEAKVSPTQDFLARPQRKTAAKWGIAQKRLSWPVSSSPNCTRTSCAHCHMLAAPKTHPAGFSQEWSVGTHVGFVVTGLKDEFLGVMLPVLHRGGRGGLVGWTQRDRLTPLSCLKRQPIARQENKWHHTGLQEGGTTCEPCSRVDITCWPDKSWFIL